MILAALCGVVKNVGVIVAGCHCNKHHQSSNASHQSEGGPTLFRTFPASGSSVDSNERSFVNV